MFNTFRNRRKHKTYKITFSLDNGRLVETHNVSFRSIDNLRVYSQMVQNDKVKIVDIYCVDDNADIALYKTDHGGQFAVMTFSRN